MPRSAAIVSAMPGYCTLTATAWPSVVMARCTWPIDAAAMGSGSHSLKICSGGAAEFRCDDAGGELGGHRRHAVLQPGQHAAGGRREAVVDVAGELPDLHQDALHGAERVGHVLRGAQRQVVAQLLALLAGGGEQPRRVRRVPGAAAGGEPHRGQPAADP